MPNTLEQIDHAIDVFRQAGRGDLIIGLTPADWDAICAAVIERAEPRHDDPGLTRDSYRDVRIVHLDPDSQSFVGHDYHGSSERHFPLNVLAPMDTAGA